MKIKLIFAAAVLSCALWTVLAVARAEEPLKTAAAAEGELQWLWGEVVSVDQQAKEVRIRYFDYDSDNEKEVSILTDDKTAYENASSLADLSPKDGITIDYVVTADGKNLARVIGKEAVGEKDQPAVQPVAQPVAQSTTPENAPASGGEKAATAAAAADSPQQAAPAAPSGQ